jgi:hypothetical protein
MKSSQNAALGIDSALFFMNKPSLLPVEGAKSEESVVRLKWSTTFAFHWQSELFSRLTYSILGPLRAAGYLNKLAKTFA